MSVTDHTAPWLLMVFSLPAKRASQRVEIWRKLKRSGTLPLRSSGHILPNTPTNQERLEWLAGLIRSYKGEASVVHVHSFDDLPDGRLRQLFIGARSKAYQQLLSELTKISNMRMDKRPPGRLNRLRKRFQEIAEIDFFGSPLRKRTETMLARADGQEARSSIPGLKAAKYHNRIWITRPRPGIDRVSSAWLIRKYIDPAARFTFADSPTDHPDAVPFDMFCCEGFGHRGEDCSFETLRKEFGIREGRVRRIAQMIHDADLGDGKFGRTEGIGLDRVLNGWARQDWTDDELLLRGMELIAGLYEGLGKE